MRSMTWDEVISALGSQAPDAYDAPPFSTVTQNLSLIDTGGPEQLSTDSLHSDLEWFASVQRALDALSARWLAELDRRQHEDHDPDPAGPCVQWLHERLHFTPNAAYAQLRMARLLELLPRTAAALRRGEISAQQAGVIGRAMEQVSKTRLDPAELESALLDGARTMDPQELLRHWQGLRYQADQEAGLEAEEEQRRRRWLSLTETWGGSYRLEGELDAEGGVTLKTRSRACRDRAGRTTSAPPSSAAPTPWSSWPGAGWTPATCRSGAGRGRT